MNHEQKAIRSFEIKWTIFWLLAIVAIVYGTYKVNFRSSTEQIEFYQMWDVAQEAPKTYLNNYGYLSVPLVDFHSLPGIKNIHQGMSIRVVDTFGQQYLFIKDENGHLRAYRHFRGKVARV